MIFHYFTKKWKWFYGRYAPSGIRVWRKTMKNDEFEKRPLFWKNSSSDGKAIFHQRVKKTMKSTIHKYVVNVTPVTNPTQYTKLGKWMVKSKKPRSDLCFTMIFMFLRKKWKWSYGQYAHSGIRVRPKLRKNDKFEKRALFPKNNSPGLKVDFPEKVPKPMKSTIHKCIVNVIPVTNPTQYTKLAK